MVLQGWPIHIINPVDNAANAKRGNTFRKESRLVLDSLLIGLTKWRVTFEPITKRSNARAKPKQIRITIDIQEKSALQA